MNQLFIDNINYGTVQLYKQDRLEKSWVFVMDKMNIIIKFDDIKSFFSCCDDNNIHITTTIKSL